MKCPHCAVNVHANFPWWDAGRDADGAWKWTYVNCPACDKRIVMCKIGEAERMLYPQGIVRPLSSLVPAPYATDFNEAARIINDSPKASAALTRRCLQHVLIDKLGASPKADLAAQIQKVIDDKLLPMQILEQLDAIRNIGNFAAHPVKSGATGQIVDVEAGEADWNLDVLESLFEEVFVRPESLKLRQDALNNKLAAAGKSPMKVP